VGEQMRMIFNIVGVRLKMLNRNIGILLLNIFIAIILLAMIGSLYEESDSINRLKIAYVDECHNEFSRAIINNLNKSEVLLPFSVSFEEGIKLIKKGDIDVMFVINEDAMEKVKDKDYEDLASIYYLSRNFIGSMLGELIGASFMREISFYYALDSIENILKDQENIEDIVESAYIRGMDEFDSLKANYYVDIEFINVENCVSADESTISNELFYKQIVVGIMLSFIAFYILFVAVNIVKDNEFKMTNKIMISKTNIFSVILGEYISIILSTMFILTLCAIINGYYSEYFVRDFCLNFIVLLCYALAYGALMLFIAKLMNKVSTYIVVGSALIFIVGIISGSFFFIDLSIVAIKNIAEAMPPYHALNQILNIISYKSLLNFNEYSLYTLVFSVFFLMISIPFFNKSRNNR
jgi:hypothetical protein